jgi:hypothetical protein
VYEFDVDKLFPWTIMSFACAHVFFCVCFLFHLLYFFFSFFIFTLEIDTLRWTEITYTETGKAMEARAFHSAVTFKDSIFIFGGEDGPTKFSSLFEFRMSKEIE